MGILATDNGEILQGRKDRCAPSGPVRRQEGSHLKTMDDNTKERPYGHCVVVGVAKTPLPITRAMCKPTPKMKKLVKKRSAVKPFVKMVNFTHLMPTRYSVESAAVKQLKTGLSADTFSESSVKKKFLKTAQAVFEQRYQEHDG